jgi:hypothetical protein
MDTDTVIEPAPSHLETAHRLNRALRSALRAAEEENDRLRARLAQYDALRVIAFGSRDRMGVAVVATGTPEGQQAWSGACEEFSRREEALAAKGVRWHAIGPVAVDRVHQTPFRPSGTVQSIPSTE